MLSPTLHPGRPKGAHLSSPRSSIHLTSVPLLAMFAQLCSVLLALSSLAAASDPGCDELIKPLEDRSKIYGKWVLHAGASDSEQNLKAKKIVNSSWVKLSAIPNSDEFTMHYIDKIEGKCVCGTVESSTTGNASKVIFHYNSTTYEHIGRFLETCADCALWTDDAVAEVNGEARKSRNLYIFTKTGKLDPADLEVFKKQAKCLNLLPDFYYLETTDLCPEEKEPTTAPTEVDPTEQ
ncbi:uncharacterized protein LOC105925476 [Fundulus heteroclitus]|uniref:Uncharacterized LOC105925476 n=1 Tax=Fundulus heteroclitus TaxID=8078 RepID=A0A3Q2P1Q1_FUNHE|nr:uncharacterized protein LOC105925476 [Fundulus heteroclitus]